MDLGACFREAWDLFKKHAVPFVVVTLLIWVVCAVLGFFVSVAFDRSDSPWGAMLSTVIVSTVAWGYGYGALAFMAQRAVDGETPAIEDLSVGFQRWGDYLVVGLVIGGAALLCFVGSVVAAFFFLFAPIFLARGSGYQDALKKSTDLAKARAGDVLLLLLTVAGLHLLSVFTCGLAGLVTVPLSWLTIVLALRQLEQPSVTPSAGGEIGEGQPSSEQ